MSLEVTSQEIQEGYRKILRAGLAANVMHPQTPEAMVFETLTASVAIGLALRAAGIQQIDNLMPSCVASCCAAAMQQVREELRKIMREDFAAKNPEAREQMI